METTESSRCILHTIRNQSGRERDGGETKQEGWRLWGLTTERVMENKSAAGGGEEVRQKKI